jgi:hypothetical protein
VSRFWKRFLVGGVATLFLLPTVGMLIEWKVTRMKGERRLADTLAALDAAEPGWGPDTLYVTRNTALPPDDQNAGVVALKALTWLPDSFRKWSTESSNWRGELSPELNRLPHDADVCQAAAVHADCDDALAVARTLHKYPRGGLPIVLADPNPLATLLKNTQDMREAASLLDLDALVLAHDRRVNEAVGSTRSLLGVARGVGDEPTLISQLVRMAIGGVARQSAERTLAWGEPTLGLAELQAELTAEATANRMTPALRGERAMIDRLLERVDEGKVGLKELGNGLATGYDVTDRVTLAAVRKYLPDQRADLIELFGQYLAAGGQPDPARRQAIKAVAIPPKGVSTMFTSLLLPAIDKVADAEDRTRANLHTAAVGIACERHRQRFGKWPATLAAIPKDILPAVPTDPYTGGPLKYVALPDGVAIYATGPDGADDGGTKLDPAGKAGTDIGFRLWNPDLRRQPPKPKPAEDGGSVDFDPPPEGGQ